MKKIFLTILISLIFSILSIEGKEIYKPKPPIVSIEFPPKPLFPKLNVRKLYEQLFYFIWN